MFFVFVFFLGFLYFLDINENGAPTNIGCAIPDANIERSAGVRLTAGRQKFVYPIHGRYTGKSIIGLRSEKSKTS